MWKKVLAEIIELEISDSKFGLIIAAIYFYYQMQAMKIKQKFSTLLGDKALEQNREVTKVKETMASAVAKAKEDCSHGACKGDTAHCRYTIINKQMDMVRSHLEPLKVAIKESFCLDLKQYVQDNPGLITDVRRKQVEELQSVLIDAAFFFGEHEIRMFLRNEVIPREGTTSATTETRLRWEWEKFNLFTGTIWGYVGKHMDESIYILKYKDRKALFDQSKQLYFAQFQNVIKSAHAIFLDPNGLQV